MSAANAVDFDDLLIKVARLTRSNSHARDELVGRFRFVLVDEFQDVNMVQYDLVKGLTADERNLCVVGDDDQSIYKWRGADVRLIRNFRRDHPNAKVIKLEQNYRSSANIVQVALSIIAQSREREPKELFSDNDAGALVSILKASDERDEAAWLATKVRERLEQGVAASEIAIFYRMHAQSRVLEEVLRSERVAYQVVGGVRFFERAEVKDVLAYLRLLRNPASDVDFMRIVNVPPRKIGGSTLDKLAQQAQDQNAALLASIPAACSSALLGSAAKKALSHFHAMLVELGDMAETAPPSELAEEILQRTGYLSMLEAEGTAEAEGRMLNLEELVASIREYEAEVAARGELPSVDGYLERITLATAGDDAKDAERVSLMTVHAAKGLEFSVVFVTGLEEETFPYRSQDPTRASDDEEERRLMYVAVTRARHELFLSHADRRALFGTTRYCLPSRFLAEIPESLSQQLHTTLARHGSTRFIDRPYVPTAPRTSLTWSRPSRREDVAQGATSGQPPVGRYVERDEEVAYTRKASRGVSAGQHVVHRSFGRGIVRDVDESDDPTATVSFSGWSLKRIKVRFLQIEET